MYRLIWATCLILVLVIVVLWLMIDQRSKEMAKIRSFVAAGNSEAPFMVNDLTRLDSVSAQGRILFFKFTLLLDSSVIDSAELERQELGWFREVACQNQEILSVVLEPGFEIVRQYRDFQEREVLNLKLSIENC